MQASMRISHPTHHQPFAALLLRLCVSAHTRCSCNPHGWVTTRPPRLLLPENPCCNAEPHPVKRRCARSDHSRMTTQQPSIGSCARTANTLKPASLLRSSNCETACAYCSLFFVRLATTAPRDMLLAFNVML
ncbi:hypothetical protein BX600DRAFT_20230 [Xylariales sp. PMI_506]|nr:hypothetical protein BX600DRAFT_20230 [Xylariales sp. PMI_506]